MNWFVNENTCFPPLASIYAFYRVHLAPLSTPPFPSLFPTFSLSLVPFSIHPLSGHPSAAHPPPSSPSISHTRLPLATPRDSPRRPVPLSFRLCPRCLRLSVFTAYILSWWRCGVMAICGGERGRGWKSEKSRKLAFETVCVWTDADFRANYNYSRDSRSPRMDERISKYLMKELL